MKTDAEIDAEQAWLSPLIGMTRAEWYAEACKVEDDAAHGELLWACRYREAAMAVGHAEQRAAVAAEERDALKRFKDWVHARLDAGGVPHDPEPEHTKEHGCRISGRMKWLFDRIEDAEAEVKRIGRDLEVETKHRQALQGNAAWTKAPPTEPGWYWWRENIEYNAVVQWVSSSGAAVAPLGATWQAAEMGGQWFGPLREPGGDAVP